jgi:hypothetical protein
MFDDINTWLRLYAAFRARASESRGFVKLHDTTDGEHWPCTSGYDAIAIGAVIDPYLRKPRGFGGNAIARRWCAVTDDIARHALLAPAAVFAENAALWRSLAAACVHLHGEGAPLPPSNVLDAMLALLAAPTELRNVGPKGDTPFKHFDNVRTFDELYVAQWKYLNDLRGFDELDPEPGMGGTTAKTPRSTNADVIALAEYWSKQLADAKEIVGHKSVEDRWRAARADIDAIARKGEPAEGYPKNNGFWRALKNTAIHVATADEAPSTWGMAMDAIKESITALPERITTGATKAADALGDATAEVAHGAGKVVSGLFSGLGLTTPLVIGAGLVGLYVITRNRGAAEKPS